MPLSYRFYLADAVFVAAVEGPHEVLAGLEQALRAPVFPLYLGRRSCPPAGQLVHGIHDGPVEEVLGSTRWLASPWVQKQHRGPTVTLETIQDCPAEEARAELVQDDPISFDPRHRRYAWRSVLRTPVTIPNPHHRTPQPTAAAALAPGMGHDPMDFFEDDL